MIPRHSVTRTFIVFKSLCRTAVERLCKYCIPSATQQAKFLFSLRQSKKGLAASAVLKEPALANSITMDSLGNSAIILSNLMMFGCCRFARSSISATKSNIVRRLHLEMSSSFTATMLSWYRARKTVALEPLPICEM